MSADAERRQQREAAHAPHRRPAGERPGSDERGRRDRSEVPVDVDERVHEERGQQQRERELVPARAGSNRAAA